MEKQQFMNAKTTPILRHLQGLQKYIIITMFLPKSTNYLALLLTEN